MDAVVLLGGCDKTVPAQLMAAASSDVPVIVDVVGSMLAGSYEGERLVRAPTVAGSGRGTAAASSTRPGSARWRARWSTPPARAW